AVAGFEIAAPLEAPVDGATVAWTERRLLFRSAARANSEAESLRQRVTAAETALRALNVPGPGKLYTLHRERMEAAVRAILQRQAVGEWVQVAIEAVVPVRRGTKRRWPVRVTVDAAARATALRRLGRRASATD